MRTLVLNSSNYVANSGGQFIYKLPQSMKFDSGSQVGISSLAVYNSSFNITSARGNNTVTVTFPFATPLTYTWTIPDGYYSIADINYFLQYQMLNNNLYVTSGNATVYFLEIVQNAVRYSAQVNSYYIPTSANATNLGYSKPSGATWSYPASNTTPQITFSTAFGALIGFSAGTFPSATQATNYSVTSSVTPTISPVNSYNITCNLINSILTIPNNFLFSLPINGSIGSLISYNASSIVWNNISPNIYNQIVITFWSQLFESSPLNDPDVVIVLAIRDAGEH
jgi:hypothetical protein